jgi:small subunit ribosomal protein S24e
VQLIEVIHPNRPSVPRAELAATLAKTFKSSADHIITFGFKIAFGGGKVWKHVIRFESDFGRPSASPLSTTRSMP